MLTLRQSWDELVRLTVEANLFRTVKAVPLNRVNDAAFLKDFPGIEMPACLIVLLGRTKTANGQATERDVRWNAVLVSKDPTGEGYADNVDRVDQWEDAVLDQQVLSDELTIHGSSDMSPAFVNPRFSIYQVAFTTREVGERAAS